MKTVLFVDPFCEYGHVNLNRTYISSLLEKGFRVNLALREGYVHDLGLSNSLVDVAIPDNMFVTGLGKLRSRIALLRILCYLKAKADLAKYDYVMFSAYEEISLYLSRIRGNLILINHANVSGMDNVIKRVFIRLISRQAQHIVFAQFIKDRFERFGIRNVVVEPQGLGERYRVQEEDGYRTLLTIDARIVSSEFKYVFFCPTGSKYVDNFVRTLVNDSDFRTFLAKSKMLLVIKDRDLSTECANIVVLKNHLSPLQYQALFVRCDSVLISYPRSFNYRVSAVFIECLANDKTCFVSDIEAFRAFHSHFNYDPYFDGIPSLKRVISEHANSECICGKPFKHLDAFNPSFDHFI